MNQLIVVCGPTASGKTHYALKLAASLKDYNPEIINADAMQLYKDIKVIAASPSDEQMNSYPHNLFGILNAENSFSVADYAALASRVIKQCWYERKLPILVGGTGLYINALINGYSPLPNIDVIIRQNSSKLLEQIGKDEFYNNLIKLDPYSNKIQPGDTQRMLRAHEVYKQTGKSITYFHAMPNQTFLENYKLTTLMLNPKREFLYRNCNNRFVELLNNGVLDEIKKLKNLMLPQDKQILKALGVRQLLDYLDNQIDLVTAIKTAQNKTRQYAKRQVTWFTHQIKDKIIHNYDDDIEFLNLIDNLQLNF